MSKVAELALNEQIILFIDYSEYIDCTSFRLVCQQYSKLPSCYADAYFITFLP